MIPPDDELVVYFFQPQGNGLSSSLEPVWPADQDRGRKKPKRRDKNEHTPPESTAAAFRSGG